ncbi:MAG: DNRLRE domain-containing protein [Gallionellaceae bacterium]
MSNIKTRVGHSLQLLALLLLTACGGGGGGSGSGTHSNIVQSITITPSFISTNTNTSQQLTATATYADGAVADLTSIARWVSAAPTMVSVSNTGLTAAGATLHAGVQITASVGGAVGKSVVTVTDSAATLQAIVVTTQTIYTGHGWLPTTWASANFSNNTGQSPYTNVQWTLSGCTPANAASVNTDGMISANSAGTCSMVASSGAITSAPKTLTIRAPSLQSIAIIPAAPSVAAGTALQLTAMGTYIDGTKKNIASLLQWSSGNTAAVNVDNAAIKGRVSGVAAGSVTITATAIVLGSDPPVTPATTTVTVPGSAPLQTTLNALPSDDNTVMYSSLVAARQTTVYQTVAMLTNPAIAVGCAWYYSPAIGFAPERMDASCSEARLKFNLAALAGKTIISATLRLQTSSVGVGIVPRQWIVRALASSWSGASLTWVNSRGSQYYVYSQSNHNAPASIGQVIDIDQTDTVRNWVAGTYQNYGLEFVLSNYLLPNINTISLDQFEFHSSEDVSGREPRLSVTYQ